MYTAAQIASNVDSAINGPKMSMVGSTSASGPMFMDIGNVESRPYYRGRAFKGRRRGANDQSQIKRDIDNDKLFLCHIQGCRPEKHGDYQKVRESNCKMVKNHSYFEHNSGKGKVQQK